MRHAPLPRRRVAALAAVLLVAGAGPTMGAAAAVPIPPGPGDGSVRHFVGASAVAHPVQARAVPRDPHLAGNGSSNMHDDAYASDAYRTGGPLGRHLTVSSATYGVEECATMAFDRTGRIEALCGGAEGSRLMLLDPRTLDVLASFPLPPRKPGTTPPTQDLCGGAYFYLDNRDRAVVETTNAQVWVVAQRQGLTGTTFDLQRTYDLSSAVAGDDCLIALMPAWDGWIWFVTEQGRVGTLNPKTGAVHHLRLPGEKIVNSFATDETGGVFIVSDHAMYRFDRGRHGRPRVTWRQRYDRGSSTKPGQLSRGSGTTPTLIGKDLVVITDNADPRMHVLSYRRTARHVEHRLVCRQSVFGKDTSDTENSVVAVGRSVIVENNYGYTGPAATMNGGSTAPGIARVGVGRRGCGIRWTSRETAPTSVPKASLANGLLYVYTKPRGQAADPWYFTALDVRTGRTVYRQLTGTGPQWNNHYASIYLGPHRTAYVPTLAGLVRLQDGPT
jgi:outer membrane protein assembly factor BamB